MVYGCGMYTVARLLELSMAAPGSIADPSLLRVIGPTYLGEVSLRTALRQVGTDLHKASLRSPGDALFVAVDDLPYLRACAVVEGLPALKGPLRSYPDAYCVGSVDHRWTLYASHALPRGTMLLVAHSVGADARRSASGVLVLESSSTPHGQPLFVAPMLAFGLGTAEETGSYTATQYGYAGTLTGPEMVAGPQVIVRHRGEVSVLLSATVTAPLDPDAELTLSVEGASFDDPRAQAWLDAYVLKAGSIAGTTKGVAGQVKLDARHHATDCYALRLSATRGVWAYEDPRIVVRPVS